MSDYCSHGIELEPRRERDFTLKYKINRDGGIMNVALLRQQIDRWLDRLSPEYLKLVASFIEFLSQKQLQEFIISQNNLAEVVPAEIREPMPISTRSQNSTVADLLEFAGTWEGDDLRECLVLVHESRAPLEFE